MAISRSWGILPTTIALITIVTVYFAFFSEGDADFCRGICRQTSEPAFCMDSLGNAVRVVSSVPEIQEILLSRGEYTVENLVRIYHHHWTTTWTRNRTDARLANIKTCTDAYTDSSYAYGSALRNYDSRNYAKVRSKLDRVVANGEACRIKSFFEKQTSDERKFGIVNKEVLDLPGHPQKKKSWWKNF